MMKHGLKRRIAGFSAAFALCGALGMTMVPMTASAADLNVAALSKFLDQQFTDKGISAQTPGCSVGLMKDGHYVINKSYGSANLEHGIPLASNSIYRTGSLSKQFTAMAIALLAEGGTLDLDADIHAYLPDVVDYGHKVTIRQMIHHVSGIPDYEDGMPALKTADGQNLRLGNEDYLTIAEFYDRAKTIPLFAPPETKWAYSNTAYFLLSQVVKKVSGMTLRQYADQHIFKPLGMSHTFFNDDVNDVVPHRVDGYRRTKDGRYKIFMTNLSWVGDGGVYTSLDDFIKWDQNWADNKLGKDPAALSKLLQTPYDMDVGDGRKYAFGLFIDQHKGHNRVAHTGSWVAFNTYYTRYPDLNMSVVTFCNSRQASARIGAALEDAMIDQVNAQ